MIGKKKLKKFDIVVKFNISAENSLGGYCKSDSHHSSAITDVHMSVLLFEPSSNTRLFLF